MLDDRGPFDLAEKAAPEHSPNRPTGVIGTKTKQERGIYSMPAKEFDQPRHTLQRPAQGIDIDLQGQRWH